MIRGAAAGMIACTVQAAIGKSEEKLFHLAPGESDFAPRLMRRLSGQAGHTLSKEGQWVLGTAFHYGYGAFWGMSYAAVRERGARPALAGVGLGALIYTITFPRWGGAVQTRTERPPEQRSTATEAMLLSVTLGFGLATAWAYEALRGRRD